MDNQEKEVEMLDSMKNHKTEEKTAEKPKKKKFLNYYYVMDSK